MPTPAITSDPLSVAIHALRAIYAGASATGRWTTVDGEEVGQDRAEPEPGYYDRDYPPSDYNSNGWCGEGEAPTQPLQPCDWETYSREEQTAWLSSCAWLAKAALTKLGVPLEAPDS